MSNQGKFTASRKTPAEAVTWGTTGWDADITSKTNISMENGQVRPDTTFELPDATGAQIDEITVGGQQYLRYLFTSDGTLHVPDAFEVDVLLLGAGGGGGGYTEWGSADGGGGGAGGLAYKSAHQLPEGDHPTRVGDGGIGSGASNGNGANGGDSTFDGLSGLGGGGGDGNNDTSKGRDGGSGGGGAIGDETEGTSLEANNQGQATQPGTNSSADFDLGHDGGAAQVNQPSGTYSAGGGGGAGEPGQDGANDVAGDGGDGKYIGDLFGDDIGIAGWIGAGGGGGAFTTTPGNGGKGGGGDGADRSTPEDAEANTGSGGGGGSADAKGGNGADGLVIIRVPLT